MSSFHTFFTRFKYVKIITYYVSTVEIVGLLFLKMITPLCLTLSNCKRLAIINIQVNFTATAMSNSYFMTNIPQSLLITVVLYAENSRLEAENV